jgi:hypothetical protein
MDYNLAFEHALSNDFVATIGYVGTLGRHSPVSINTNSTTVLLPSGTTQAFLPFPDFTGSSDMLHEGICEYNGLQTKLQKRTSHGLDFSANYTWSHSLDDTAGTSVFKGEQAYSKSEAMDLLRSTASLTDKPIVYLSAGVSNSAFVESPEMAAGSGVKYHGVLCGRATCQGERFELRAGRFAGTGRLAGHCRPSECQERQ